MNVPLLDLKAQFQTIETEVREAINRVLGTQYFINGPELKQLEEDCARYLDAKHAIGVSSGTDALLVSLMALDIGPGDEVITTPYTFFSTAGCIARLGAKPVFVDIQSTDYNINPKHLEAAITANTKAIIPVHLYGQSADMAPILECAKKHKIAIIEDAAQAIGTQYQGKRVGTLGDLGCFSFFPSKNLGGIGDGGLVTTNDDLLAEKIQILRAHGSKPKYHHKYVGGNFRLDAINAAVLQVKLKHLDEWTLARQKNANIYDEIFAVSDGIRVPWRREGDRHIFNQYVLKFKNQATRDKVQTKLKENQIGCEIYYPVPMHLQECFQDLGHQPGDFPISEDCANTTLAIPVYPECQLEQLQTVAQHIEKAIEY